jgi:ribosomal protein S18 acetylase RimI-like enzyme
MIVRSWDSEFFAVRIGSADLGHERLETALRNAREAGVECLYLTADADQLDVIAGVARRRARLVTVRHTLSRNGNGVVPSNANHAVELASRADEARIRQLAEDLAPYSRFAADPRFEQARVAAMYRVWADRCLADGVVSVGPEGTGFVGITLDEGTAHVALVYVDGGSSGRGLGRALLAAALEAAGERPAEVATDAGNVAAARMYQSAGFRTKSMKAIFHLWLDELRDDGASA